MWLWTVKFVAKFISQITLNILTKHFRPIDRIKKSYKQLTQLACTGNCSSWTLQCIVQVVRIMFSVQFFSKTLKLLLQKAYWKGSFKSFCKYAKQSRWWTPQLNGKRSSMTIKNEKNGEKIIISNGKHLHIANIICCKIIHHWILNMGGNR